MSTLSRTSNRTPFRKNVLKEISCKSDLNSRLLHDRPVISLGHQEGQRAFCDGPKFFKLCGILSNYVQHIFPGGRKILQRG